MEHNNVAGFDAEAGNVVPSQLLGPIPGNVVSSTDPSGSLPIGASSAIQVPTLFGAPHSAPEAVRSASNPTQHAQPSVVFQFPPFGQITPPSSEPTTLGFSIFGTSSSVGASSSGLLKFTSPVEPQTSASPSPSFGGSAPVFGRSSASAPTSGCSTGATNASPAPAFGYLTQAASSSIPAGFGCSTGATSGSAQSFGFSAGGTSSPAFGCSVPFPFPMKNNPAVPSRLDSCTWSGFNRSQWWLPSCSPPCANPLRLNVKRCYCGKVAGIRFSNKTDCTLGLFYCCPDYNEEAIRNGTQDRNYCTYKEWSNNFSIVRRCYCGKIAVLQKSERFNTRDMLFYSCPEFMEKDVMTGRCNRDHCSYLEWHSPPVSF